MPRKYLMSWLGRDACWKKMFRGVLYRVTCNELNAPHTELGSYQAANDWWLQKLQSLDAAKPHSRDYQRAIANQLDLALAHDTFGQPEAAVTRRKIVKQLQADLTKDNPPALDRLTINPMRGMSEAGAWVMDAKIKAAKNTATTKAKTIGPHIDTFLQQLRARVKPQSYREVRNYLADLKETAFFAETLPLERITEGTVDGHYLYLASLDIKPAGKNKYLGFFRRFVEWLGERRLLPNGLPANLKSKAHRFKVPKKKIKRWDGIKETLDELPDDFRLWALLGLNCGMTQADLGAVEWSWINLKAGTLTRQRVKLETVEDAPEVTYKLWPETLALLKARPNKKGRVFQTADGGPMYDTRYVEEDGETIEKKKDLFSTYWQRWEFVEKKNVKKGKRPTNPIPIPLGKFRNVGSTTLKRGPHRGFRDVYLANVPDGIGDIHYADETYEPGCPFWSALEFIRSELGIGAKTTK